MLFSWQLPPSVAIPPSQRYVTGNGEVGSSEHRDSNPFAKDQYYDKDARIAVDFPPKDHE
jgi:hypothetical protein